MHTVEGTLPRFETDDRRWHGRSRAGSGVLVRLDGLPGITASLRHLLACDGDLCRAVRRSFLRAVFEHYREGAQRAGLARARTGAVNALQRFGPALNLSSAGR